MAISSESCKIPLHLERVALVKSVECLLLHFLGATTGVFMFNSKTLVPNLWSVETLRRGAQGLRKLKKNVIDHFQHLVKQVLLHGP